MERKNVAKTPDRIVLKRLSLAGISSCALLLFFYWIGNFQQFLDSSLLLLLTILGWAAPLTGILSFSGLMVICFHRERGEPFAPRVAGLVCYCLSIAACGALFVLSRFLVAVLRGA